jgi:cytochrome c oxidase assembly protein subunit 11
MAIPASRTARNRTVVLLSLGVVAAMFGLVAASVPLYQLFCQVTGFGGTTQRAEAPSAVVSDRTITVRFNADVNSRLPWRFHPEQRDLTLAIGESGLAFYQASNLSPRAITGTATFNVTPYKAGPYFNKIECFCFTEQTLQPGETVDMPVTFFIDPAILDDPNLADVHTITLSYTFFEAVDGNPPAADEEPTARLAPAPGSGGQADVN